jgi:hypothetical protein
MDLDNAISVHVQWKSKLSAFIARPDNSLNADSVAKDNQCELGQWLYGEGRAHSKLPEFAQLTVNHARFHKAAGNLIQKVQSGESVTEEIALGSKSEYAAASNAVVGSLMSMKKKLCARN